MLGEADFLTMITTTMTIMARKRTPPPTAIPIIAPDDSDGVGLAPASPGGGCGAVLRGTETAVGVSVMPYEERKEEGNIDAVDLTNRFEMVAICERTIRGHRGLGKGYQKMGRAQNCQYS